MIEANIIATTNNFNDAVGSWTIIATRNIGSNGTTGDVDNPDGDTQTIVHKAVTGVQVNNPSIDTAGMTNIIKVTVNGDASKQLKYGGFIKLTYMGYGENVC